MPERLNCAASRLCLIYSPGERESHIYGGCQRGHSYMSLPAFPGMKIVRCTMIYYRVALQDKQTRPWKWKSTVLTSIDALLLFLRTYRAIPKEDMRVFFSSSTEGMEEMLSRQNQGLVSNSVSADQLLSSRSMNLSE